MFHSHIMVKREHRYVYSTISCEIIILPMHNIKIPEPFIAPINKKNLLSAEEKVEGA